MLLRLLFILLISELDIIRRLSQDGDHLPLTVFIAQ